MRSLLLLTLCACLSRAWQEVSSDVEVDTPRGRLRGKHVNFGSNRSDFYYGEADVFLGIPYVLPPERFKKPVANCQYTANGEPLVVQEYGPACYQAGESCGDSELPMSEDCLTLNVFTPDVKSNYKYPVMLYIHGGGLMYGCAQEYPYDGAIVNLVNRGVVVVTFQYRLSMLGFFTTLTPEYPANIGMYDQVEALRWVKDQISHFGGDPYRITLFGQSAGGVSVSAHTYSPLSQDLIQQAIMESGVALMLTEGSMGVDNLSRKRAQELCKVSQHDFDSGKWDKMTQCLMNMDAKDLVKLDTINIIGWRISPGDDFMPDIPHNLAKFRNNMPILIGSMKDEWSYYDTVMFSLNLTREQTYTRKFFEFEFDLLGGFLGDRKQDMLKILEDVYAGVEAPDDDHTLWLRAGCAAFTSAGFTSMIQRDFQDYLANGNKRMWLYEMTYPKSIFRTYDLPGFPEAVGHNSELPYIWKQKKDFNRAIDDGTVNQDDYDLVEWFGETWTNFAKYGRPYLNDNWPNLPTTGTEIYMDINSPNPVVSRGYMTTDNIIWNQVLVALHGDFFPAQFNVTSISKEEFDQIKSSASSLVEMCTPNDYTYPPPLSTSTIRSTLSTLIPSTSIISSTLSYFTGHPTVDDTSSTLDSSQSTLIPSTSLFTSTLSYITPTTSSSSFLFGWPSIVLALLSIPR